MPVALRTFAPLLRTARLSLRQNQNPLVSLQRETRKPVLNFARNYAVYQRTKPHVNIGMAIWQLAFSAGFEG
jgi:elongation factor Tu